MTLAQQYRYNTLASNVIVISTILAGIISFSLRQLRNTSVSHAAVVLVALFSLFLLLLAYFIRKGRRWAKFVYFIITGFMLLPVLFDYKRLAATTFISPADIALYVSQDACYVLVSALLILSLRKPTPAPTWE